MGWDGYFYYFIVGSFLKPDMAAFLPHHYETGTP
jgi:hypothetical protein